ncbi:MAG: MmgE/PrpD family protein, partial [Pseudonocardiales bacterium]|nr:MmgE/PrpD family protein [Pseudonocardiales bacterium]
PDLADDRLRRLADGMLVRESPTMTAAFPALREADVTLVLADGRRISSGPTTACGDPEQPLSTSTLIEKFRAGARPVLGDDRAERLLAVLTAEQDLELAELTDQLCPPIG